MKANPAEAVLAQNLLKLLRNLVRLDQRTHLVYTDEIQKALVVTSPAQVPLVCLMLLQVHEILIGILAKGQCPHTGIALGRIFPDYGLNFPIVLFFDDGSGNGDGALLEVDCRPA